LKYKIIDFETLSHVHVYRIEYVSYRQGPYRICIDTADDRIVPALVEWTACTVLYTRPLTVSHALSRSCTTAYTITHERDISTVFFSFKNLVRLSLVHSNGPSMTRIRPRLVRLYVRFTRVNIRVRRVPCVS